MGLSIWQILLVVVLLILLFGRGKIPALMSDIASGIKGFRKEMESDKPIAMETLEPKKEESSAAMDAEIKAKASETRSGQHQS
jgi:sec-independent protein translocase protein TatA